MSPKLGHFFLALLLGALFIQVGLNCAKAEPPYEIVLEDEFGNRLPTYAHRGEWFAQGREGQRYNVRVVNNSGRRVEAVVTVDGRDVLSGQPGDFKSQRGYLVPAYGSVVIDGFRTSLSEVAAFRFTHPDNSYSSRMGTPENVGVVGAAFFPEREREPVYRPQIPRRPYYEPYSGNSHDSRRKSGSYDGLGSSGPGQGGGGRAEAKPAAPSASAPAAEASARAYREQPADDESNIGTEYGEQQYSAVTEVAFTRARKSPDRVLTVRYDDYEGLLARGVLPRPAPRPYAGPSAFPVNRFAPPPPPPRSYWN
ncbi:MAG: hypothetical protein QM778_19975 [Myxococcales bacterium]